jgi:hypothetical protein
MDDGRAAGDKWAKIDALVRRPTDLTAQPTPPELPLSTVETRIEVIKNQRLGVFSRLKAGSIAKQAALEEIRALSAAHLEATKHALSRALEVDKQRVDLVAQKYIYQITEEHLKDMREMGLQNYDTRLKTLLKLNEETSKLLQQASGQDVPEFMRQQTIERIVKRYQEFSDTIMGSDPTIK